MGGKGGGGGGGGIDPSVFNTPEFQWYWTSLPPGHQELGTPEQHYENSLIWNQQHPLQSHGFHMPEFGMHIPEGPSYEEQLAEQQRIQGENQRDALYSEYMDAAGSAVDYINAEIDKEAANAALLGIDYTIDDEMKATRVSDYFASIWGEGQQSELEALIAEWGDPEGFEGFTITRGDASKYAGEGTPGSTKTVGAGKGIKPATALAAPEEEYLGGAKTLLGGA